MKDLQQPCSQPDLGQKGIFSMDHFTNDSSSRERASFTGCHTYAQSDFCTGISADSHREASVSSFQTDIQAASLATIEVPLMNLQLTNYRSSLINQDVFCTGETHLEMSLTEEFTKT